MAAPARWVSKDTDGSEGSTPQTMLPCRKKTIIARAMARGSQRSAPIVKTKNMSPKVMPLAPMCGAGRASSQTAIPGPR